MEREERNECLNEKRREKRRKRREKNKKSKSKIRQTKKRKGVTQKESDFAGEGEGARANNDEQSANKSRHSIDPRKLLGGLAPFWNQARSLSSTVSYQCMSC